MVGDVQSAGTPSRGGVAFPLAYVVAAHVERSLASATSFLLQLDDGARAIAEQLAGSPVSDARGIEVAVLGRRSRGVEE